MVRVKGGGGGGGERAEKAAPKKGRWDQTKDGE